MLGQSVLVHVRVERAVGDGMARFDEHVGPAFDVFFVDILEIIIDLFVI